MSYNVFFSLQERSPKRGGCKPPSDASWISMTPLYTKKLSMYCNVRMSSPAIKMSPLNGLHHLHCIGMETACVRVCVSVCVYACVVIPCHVCVKQHGCLYIQPHSSFMTIIHFSVTFETATNRFAALRDQSQLKHLLIVRDRKSVV